MRLYGQLAFGDYDAASGILRVQPPAMVWLPVGFGSGRRMLLLGARTPALLSRIKEVATTLGVQVRVESQRDSNARLLLPDRVELTAIGSSIEAFGGKRLKQLAEDCGIKFCADLVQAELLSFSVNLNDYQQALQPYAEELPDDWKQSWFNPQTLGWEEGAGNKLFCLTEFEFTVYRKQCYLWQNGVAYAVDKSWGRYLMLAHAKKRVLLYSGSQNLLKVPAAAPLPELPARAAALLSGYAPEQEWNPVEKRLYNVYQADGAYQILYNRLGKLLGQPIVEIL